MFELLQMIGNYDSRKVTEPYEKDGLFVSTARVTDSDQPYETAISHPKYNNNKLIIVELYDSFEEAKQGHLKWIKKMTAKKLPRNLYDVSTSNFFRFLLPKRIKNPIKI